MGEKHRHMVYTPKSYSAPGPTTRELLALIRLEVELKRSKAGATKFYNKYNNLLAPQIAEKAFELLDIDLKEAAEAAQKEALAVLKITDSEILKNPVDK